MYKGECNWVIKSINYITIFLNVAILFSCTDKHNVEGQGIVGVSVNVQDIESLNSVEQLNAAFITIKDNQGKYKFNMEKLTLNNESGAFLLEDITLNNGSYQIEEFLVVNSKDSLVCLTPKITSKHSSSVSTALPLPFTVESNDIKRIEIDVISNLSGEISDYGYSKFGINIENIILKGLLFHAPFNGNAKDAVQEVLPIGGADICDLQCDSWRECYLFDGENDYLSYNLPSFNVTSEITVSCWVRTDFNDIIQWVVGKYGPEEAGFHIYINGGFPQFNGRTRNDEYIICQADKKIDGSWHHIVGIVNNNIWEIWVDGRLSNRVITNHENVNLYCSSELDIGYYTNATWSPKNYTKGKIDDVRIYGRALSPLEIEVLYANSVKDSKY